MAGVKRLCNISVDDQEYYLLTTETEHRGELDAFDIILSDGQGTWAGQVTAEDLEGFSNKVHMDYDDVVAQTRKALTNDDVGNINFLYQTKSSGNKLQFLWKKHIPTDNIKFQLGSADLIKQADSSDAIKEIFNHSISSVGSLQEQINSLKSDNERLVSERATALKRLEKYVSAKEDIEQELYSKFTVVLNDKKAKLRDLRDENEELRAGGGDAGNSNGSADPGPSRSTARRGRVDDDSADETDGSEADTKVKEELDSEYNTDEDEKVAVPSKKARKVKTEPMDTSGELMLDAQDDDDDVPTTSRRRRQRAGSGKKQTPSKPIIPKLPSSDQKSKPGTSRQRSGRQSLQKVSSVHSKSSDNIDAEDLLDDF